MVRLISCLVNRGVEPLVLWNGGAGCLPHLCLVLELLLEVLSSNDAAVQGEDFQTQLLERLEGTPERMTVELAMLAPKCPQDMEDIRVVFV